MPFGGSAAEAALARASWEGVIYAEPPRRADLLALKPSWPLQPIRIQVIRNQPFEYVASVLRSVLAFAELDATISYSDYDDSLTTPPDPAADVIVVWLDYDRYRQLPADELVTWLEQRLQLIRAGSRAPILISNDPGSSGDSLLNRSLARLSSLHPGIHIADQSMLAQRLGPAYRDERTATLAGTTMSDLASLYTARLMGLSWLPALLLTPIKAVVVDLDGTLYAGVLAEDGSKGVALTPDFVALQQRLLELRDAGIFLAAASRNQPEDVEALFRDRTDMPVRAGDFSALKVSWEDKASAVRGIATDLRIGEDALLFIDDNPGELASVASALPLIRTLHASDPAVTRRALDAFPGLFRWSRTAEDALRINDLAVAALRQQIPGGDPDAYLRSLKIELGIEVDEPSHIQRLHELSMKTNQFNTALRRFTEGDVAHYVEDRGRHALAISLRDRLSDSGIVGAIFITRQGEVLIVDEIAISCRALGRRLERLMILASIDRVAAGLASIKFAFTPGPRNQPARLWLAELVGPIEQAGEYSLTWNAADVAQEISQTPVKIRRLGP
jgi:FkbH-like protein